VPRATAPASPGAACASVPLCLCASVPLCLCALCLCALCPVPCALCPVPCALCSVRCALWSVRPSVYTPPVLKRLLIANRGEIAVRVIRAARGLGIPVVAVHSEADRDALHVRLADAAVCIGPAEARLSYLDRDRILAAARETGADSVHPGYGFLSQDPDFADACEAAGLVFVGPTGACMRLMGQKVPARRAMVAAGVPVVPGTLEPVGDVLDAIRESDCIGYPVMLKASAGGGGKGIRLVEGPADMPSAFERARAEALSAFGRGDLYLEKAVDSPRHIEVQVVADARGNVAAVGERECSLQRRHQKVLEECPANRLSPATRAALADAAVRAAAAIGYRNAGTVEFLVDGAERFHFLEMNTRIQVEHPVTEEVYGVDLVREQLRIAAGEPLSFAGAALAPRGHALEARICAEDPEQGFLPSTGIVEHLEVPSGPGIRFDAAVYEGMEVGVHYDPLLGKLVAWGPDRPAALARMRTALDELVLAGLPTTAPFLRRVMDHPDIVAGRYDTGFLGGPGRALLDPAPADEEVLVAAVAAVLHRRARPARTAAAAPGPSPWAAAARREHPNAEFRR
jgi:acetyl-CoA carboxylase biotin carboxylase subunit